MIRNKKQYSVSEVLSNVKYGRFNIKVEFDGDLIKMNSHRYQLFLEKGCTCVCCGIEGTVFFKEKHFPNEPYHFNLYAEVDGEYILMTKDHIMPRSKGGKNHINNYQVMCTRCNHEKDDMYDI